MNNKSIWTSFSSSRIGKKIVSFLIKSKHKEVEIKSKRQKLLVIVSVLLLALKFILLFGFFIYLIFWMKKRI